MSAVTKRTMLAVLVLSVVIVPVVALRSQEEESLLKTLSDKLATQETAWNQGDLPGFMGAYWKSEKLTFSAVERLNVAGTLRWLATRVDIPIGRQWVS